MSTRAGCPPRLRDLADLDPAGPYLYVQIADALLAAIVDGTYPIGDRPSKLYGLRHRWDVGDDTLRKALQTLEHEGLISGAASPGAQIVAVPGNTW